jgi:hypothetical protein
MRSQDSTRQKIASVAFDVRTPGSSAFKSLRVHSFAFAVPFAAISVFHQSRFTFHLSPFCVRFFHLPFAFFALFRGYLDLTFLTRPICANLRLSAVRLSAS